jgi:hypothetical protein
MYHLATIFPPIQKVRIPVSRDQAMLLMMALNELLLGLETYLAHLTSGTIVPYEYIPIIFGPTAGVLLLLAGLISIRKRSMATIIAMIVFIVSIIVGLLGAYFHLVRAMLPNAPGAAVISVPLLVWAPPLLGPLTFVLVGLIGLSSLWLESPPDSGILNLFGDKRLEMPYSKTRVFFLIVSLAALATVTSSVLDHARTNFSNPWLWLPTGIGIFAVVVSALLGTLEKPSRTDLLVYLGAMLLMILVGVLGVFLHIQRDLTSQGVVVTERFLRGAPFMAPMLFSDIGTIGLLVLLDPREVSPKSKSS